MILRLREVSLRLKALTLQLDVLLDKKVTALFGPSGSGKTTVLELVAGLRHPQEGTIELDGRTLVNPRQGIFVPPQSRQIGYVPQDLALFPHLTVRQNIVYGFGKRDGPHAQISPEKLCQLLDIEHLLDRKPRFLSGGEKQRVAIARALLRSPQLLLFDEPLTSLDQSLKDRIMPYLEIIRDEFAIPMLYVSHSPAELMALCEDVVVLEKGKCVAHGVPDKLFTVTRERIYRLS